MPSCLVKQVLPLLLKAMKVVVFFICLVTISIRNLAGSPICTPENYIPKIDKELLLFVVDNRMRFCLFPPMGGLLDNTII
jgi:hypothetical protein